MSESNFNLYGDVSAPSDDFLYGQEGYAVEDDGSIYEVDYKKNDSSRGDQEDTFDLEEASGIGEQNNHTITLEEQGSIKQVDDATPQKQPEGSLADEPELSSYTAEDVGNSEKLRLVNAGSDLEQNHSKKVAPPFVEDSVGSDTQFSASIRPMSASSGQENESIGTTAGVTGKDGFEPIPSGFDAQPRALILEDLNWWTSDEDLTLAVAEAGVLSSLVPSELGFSEHRINGKSKGICFILFTTSAACMKAKDFFERIEIHGRKPTVKLAPSHQQHCPFRALPRDPKQTRIESAVRRPMAQTGGNESTQRINLGTQLLGGIGARPHSNSNFGYPRPHGVPSHMHETPVYYEGQHPQFYNLPTGIPMQKGFGARGGTGVVGAAKNMHLNPSAGRYFENDTIYNPLHIGGMGYYPMEYEYDSWMDRMGAGGPPSQNLPLRIIPSNVYVQSGSSVTRNQVNVEHSHNSGFSGSSTSSVGGRFRPSFQSSNIEQRTGTPQNTCERTVDHKITRNKFKPPSTDDQESVQDRNNDALQKGHQPDYEPHQRLVPSNTYNYYRDDVSNQPLPQTRHPASDKTSRPDSQRFPPHTNDAMNRSPDTSPPQKKGPKSTWGDIDESCYNNDAAIIPLSPREVDTTSPDDHLSKDPSIANREPSRVRSRDKTKRFSSSGELNGLSPRTRSHSSPNRKPQSRSSSYKPQSSRSNESHDKFKQLQSDFRDPVWNEGMLSTINSRYKSPTITLEHANKTYKSSQSLDSATSDSYPYDMVPQTSSFNKDVDTLSRKPQAQHVQTGSNNHLRSRPRQKPHVYYNEKDPDDPLPSRPPTVPKRNTFSTSKPHDPQDSPQQHPQINIKSPPPFYNNDVDSISPNIGSPTWSQPCRLKKKPNKEWLRLPEKDVPAYPDQGFSQRDRSISFMRNGADAKRHKHKSNTSDYHGGSNVKRSRGHERGERSSTNWKRSRQH